MRPRYVLEKAEVTDPAGGRGPGWQIVDHGQTPQAIIAEVFDKDFAAYLEELLRR